MTLPWAHAQKKQILAEGVGFEPTEAETRLSGLANRRTRPTMRPFRMVPKGGLEPPRAYAHNALNVACLPIPPLWRGVNPAHLPR